MDMNDIKHKTHDIKDDVEQRVEEAKENVEDMTQGIREDINRKGGEVKGRADQWAEDHDDADDNDEGLMQSDNDESFFDDEE